MDRISGFFVCFMILASTTTAFAEQDCNKPCGGGYGKVLDSFNGETAYSNGDCSGGCSGIYQCVEFIKRVYKDKIKGKANDGHNTCQWISGLMNDESGNSFAGYGFTYYANGSTTPQVGDVLCFDGGAGGAGHVGVITNVVTTLGDEHVIMMDQNRKANEATVQLGLTASGSGYTIGSFSTNYTATGWARNPDYSPLGYTVHGPAEFTQAFQDAYTALGGEATLGLPFNVNNGTPYVHVWGNDASGEPVNVQDFVLGNTWSVPLWTQLIYNPDDTTAYLVAPNMLNWYAHCKNDPLTV